MVAHAHDASIPRLGFASVLTLALVVLASLFIYKWGGALRAVGGARGAGVYTPTELIATAGLPLLAASGAKTINYLAVIWPALLFGVLVAGMVRAFVSVGHVVRLLGSGVVRQQLLAGAVGMPLMLCSCCIAPVFSTVRSRGAPLGAALALAFSSPSLNVAALTLTFMLLPLDVALASLVMAVFAVFVLPVLIERALGENLSASPQREEAGSLGALAPRDPIQAIGSWAVSSGKVAAETLPGIFLGVFASGILVGSLEHSGTLLPNLGLTIAL